ncbi:MAG: chalcone isomerase family protein [Betaproteobacteria bacterium]
MSRSTPSSPGDAARVAARAFVCAAIAVTATTSFVATAAPPLPSAVTALAPGLLFQGGGEMTFFGFAIYDGWYWSPIRGFSIQHPLALDLEYKRNLEGKAIAARSVEEITKLALGTAEERVRWGELMRRIFPDVAKGDRLTGLSLPPGTVRFFHNGRAIGEIDDRDFARAFFGIWLDPATSRPDFRRRLLGEEN